MEQAPEPAQLVPLLRFDECELQAIVACELPRDVPTATPEHGASQLD